MIIQPNKTSKSLSIICISLFVIFLSITAYLVSALKNEIHNDKFTISQAIAFGNQPGMIILLVSAFGVLSYLTYYRGYKYLFLRLFMYFLICSLIITIVWITPYYNIDDHNILAGIIFATIVLTIILNSYLIYNGLLTKTKKSKYVLTTIPILSIIGLIGAGFSSINVISDKPLELFAAFENYMAVVLCISIFTLGFM